MESEFEIREEVRRLGTKVDLLFYSVRGLAESIRSTQKPMRMPEFAERVGISIGKLRKLVKEGQIVRKGKMIPPTELRKFDI